MIFNLIPLRYEYLSILIFILIVTLIIDYIYKVSINSDDLFQVLGMFFLTAMLWNWYAISHGHWTFLPENACGIYFMKIIPLEDVLVILIVPYFVLIIYNLIKGNAEKEILTPLK